MSEITRMDILESWRLSLGITREEWVERTHVTLQTLAQLREGTLQPGDELVELTAALERIAQAQGYARVYTEVRLLATLRKLIDRTAEIQEELKKVVPSQ